MIDPGGPSVFGAWDEPELTQTGGIFFMLLKTEKLYLAIIH